MKCSVSGEVGYEQCSGYGERTSVEYDGNIICSYCRDQYTDAQLQSLLSDPDSIWMNR